MFGRWRIASEFRPSPSPFARLKIALLSDDLTRACLRRECRVMNVTPDNFDAVRRWGPDLLLVESCWNGFEGQWRYGIASYPDVPERNNDALAALVAVARDAGIPAIFWNREDGVHFDRFIASARLFDRVLTVDETMIPAYRDALGPGARVGTMMFAASRYLHQPRAIEPERRAAFVGSYGAHVHDRRRAWQDAMFEAAKVIGLTVYDRNSDRKPERYRYPERDWITTRPAVPPTRVPAIFRRHAVNLNVNTIVDSPSAFSRRLVEILACGALALTNDSAAVRAHFADDCVISDDPEEAFALFERIAREGRSAAERERCLAAARHVRDHHSWTQRIPILLDMAGRSAT